MTILSPHHLFDQADRLVRPPSAGAPRQVDLRRAISAAYYGVFHFTMAALADLFVGATQRASATYALVYRSVDHRTLKDLCADVQKQSLPRRYMAYTPANGLGPHLRAFALTASDLQEKRHEADYDPTPRFLSSDARVTISTARKAVGTFALADAECQRAFLTFLLCPPR